MAVSNPVASGDRSEEIERHKRRWGVQFRIQLGGYPILGLLNDGRSVQRLRSGEWVVLRDYG